MLNFFLIPLLFFLIEISSCFAQDFQNSLSKKNNIYSNYYDNYQDDIENYQLNYANPTTPNNYIQSLTNKSIEVKNQRDYNANNYNYAPSSIAEKNIKILMMEKELVIEFMIIQIANHIFVILPQIPKKSFHMIIILMEYI